MSRLKTTQWNDRGELLHDGVVVPGSNVVDLVHDLLRKRKTSDPIGWQKLGSQMRAANIPMELVGNVARRRHIQQRKRTLTPKQKKGRRVQLPTIGSLKTRPLSRDRHNMAQPCTGVVIIIVVAVIIFTAIVSSMSGWRSKLQQRYYDPKRVGSYGGVAALRGVVPEQDVECWLSEQDTYTLHKPVRGRFKRRCVVVGGPNQQWQADLVDMSRLKKVNDGTTFILTVIDVFSKLAWSFTQLLSNGAPNTLQTDKGTEFLNRSLQKLLKEHGVHRFATHNEETKAIIVERFNRTLKARMWRYFTKSQSVRYLDVLQDFVRS